jgi:hypothetical protein
MSSKYDYISLRNQYVQGTMGIRELCRQNNIPTWSTVAKRAKDESWDHKREEFQRQVENKSLEALSQKRANKVAEIQIDALEVIHMGILKLAADMNAEEPWLDSKGDPILDKNGHTITRALMHLRPQDLGILIDKFQSLIGAPQAVTENRSLGINISSEADHDTLRALLATLRPQLPEPGTKGSIVPIDPERTRAN